MHAIRVHEFGGPDVLRYEEVAQPSPGPGAALVKVEASGINFADTLRRRGGGAGPTPVLPYVPGGEAAGDVETVGDGVTDVKPGDRVVSNAFPGSYAEYAVAPAAGLVPIPPYITTPQAAAAFSQGLTAHYLANSTYPINAGDSVLVHAAAGGVGLLLVQMAKLRGARVIGTVSTAEKAKLAQEAGADDVILYTETDFAPEVRRLTGGEGVHAVYDSVGAATFAGSLDSLRPRGLLALYGQSSGPVPPLDTGVLGAKGSLFLTRPGLAHHIATRAELLERIGAIFGWIAEGRLTLHIGGSFALAGAAEAHRRLEGRATSGKLLLIP
jgi:NADPH2:quinone reductase